MSAEKRPAKLPFYARFVLLPALLGAIVSTAVLLVPPAGWTTNDVTTGQSRAYPDMQARQYDSSPANTTQVAAATASTQSGWKVVSTDVAQGVVKAEVQHLLPAFTDEVTITVTPTGPSNDFSAVVIRSHSRLGPGDLGSNARNIRALQTAMDDKLPAL